MSKEQFVRSNTHINIGDIAYQEHGKTVALKASEFASISYDKYEQMVLQGLIDTYGKEEGLKHFENLKREAEEKYRDFQNIDATQEEREDSINISRRK